jgi:hypothetical protein
MKDLKLKLLEEKIGGNPCDHGLGNAFLEWHSTLRRTKIN